MLLFIFLFSSLSETMLVIYRKFNTLLARWGKNAPLTKYVTKVEILRNVSLCKILVVWNSDILKCCWPKNFLWLLLLFLLDMLSCLSKQLWSLNEVLREKVSRGKKIIQANTNNFCYSNYISLILKLWAYFKMYWFSKVFHVSKKSRIENIYPYWNA